MESWGRLTRCNCSNRCDPCDAPRTDLLLRRRCRSPSNKDRMHDLSKVDPHVRCGRSSRALPSRARRLRSREEGVAELRDMVEIRSTREERGGAALWQKNKLVCPWGCPPPHPFIVGGEGRPLWRRGQP